MLSEGLIQRFRAFQESRVLLTAVELDVFTAIGAGAREPDVAARLNTDPRATGMLLNALTALGLLEKREGVFFNSAEAASCFVKGSPDDQRLATMHLVQLWPRWSALTECVRTGTAAAREGMDVEAFIGAMHSYATGRAPEMARAIGVDGVRRMLDLGGGSGAYSIAFAQANLELHAEVLDMAGVAPIAQRHIAAAGLTGRVTTRVGDMLAGRFGTGYDLTLLASICHMFAPEENRALLAACYEALAPGGRVVVSDFLLDPDRAGPPHAALFALNMLTATAGGDSYTEQEYASWMQQAGFSEIRRVDLPGPASLVIGRKGAAIR